MFVLADDRKNPVCDVTGLLFFRIFNFKKDFKDCFYAFLMVLV